MSKITHLSLDVLKAHKPDVVDFAKQICARGPDYTVIIRVVELDERTETLEVQIDGDDIRFDDIRETISRLGGSVHSIDRVVVGPSDNSDER